MEKRLMILGAGPGQLPAIRKAISLGCFVITVDNVPDNIGHRFSHQAVNCSTVDRKGVLDIARKLEINGIATFASDIATPAVGFVAEQLGLPGYDFQIAQTMSNKAKFRIFQKQKGLNRPCFAIGKSLQEIEEQIASLTMPVMFKPVDTSGSRGVTRLEELDRQHCAAAFTYARRFSRLKTVCVEEFLPGVEVGGDGFLVNGRLAFAVITYKHKKNFIPVGHSLPTNISTEDQKRVLAEVATHCRAAGYTDGPLNFDVIVSPERVIVLEMSPRSGGNGIPVLIERHTGVDLLTVTLLFSLGESVGIPGKKKTMRGCGSWVFGSEYSGRLQSIATKEELMSVVPEIFEFFVSYKTGDIVPDFVHSGNSLGYILFDCHSSLEYGQNVEIFQDALRLKVDAAAI